ncbi:MAG: arginine decarboxylase, pyruvoyl-dependent [Clostridia bacterium]|nr:arginine decarboxylase, pyruvoyl-dependent [Clostridia bacterium]
MLATPTCFWLVSGVGEGGHPLTAFDAALLAAGVGNVNLLKVSSILPPNAAHSRGAALPPGALVPIAYGAIVGSEPGQRLAAAVAVAVAGSGRPGVIVEHSLRGSRREAEDTVADMAREACRRRGYGEPHELHVRGVEHVVQTCGCAFAGVVLWYCGTDGATGPAAAGGADVAGGPAGSVQT